jgi:hypothetical protein
MTPSFTERARFQWATLPEAQFEAVYQIRAGLDDVAASGDWRHVHVVGDVTVGPTEVRVVENLDMFVLVEVNRLQVFALGQPGL